MYSSGYIFPLPIGRNDDPVLVAHLINLVAPHIPIQSDEYPAFPRHRSRDKNTPSIAVSVADSTHNDCIQSSCDIFRGNTLLYCEETLNAGRSYVARGYAEV